MALRILFVDDEPAVLKLFKTMVEPLGFEVLTIVDSREASQKIRREKFDGIFLDAHMPHLDGFQLAKMVRVTQSNAKVPMVMLTGYNDADTMRKGFQAGVSFFLSKPFTQAQLAGLLRAMRGVMLQERRRYARLPFRSMVTCRIGAKAIKTESINISEGGMLLQSSGGASLGQEIDLEFRIPTAPDPLKMRAKVVRKGPPDETGVQFINLDSADQKVIQAYISGRITE